MPLSKMVDKADKLLRQKRVAPLDGGRYNVIGDHGTYLVQVSPNGSLSCNCPGFQSKRRCSHVAAVLILREIKKGKG
ncbi:MAG: SWIM zinc finger family protein [Candidatus Bathyarchaeia archaeon]